MVELLDWRQANLDEASAVKPVFASVEQAFLGSRIGELSRRDKFATARAVAAVLGFKAAPSP